MSPVSAWASKCSTLTRPQPTARATPVTSGQVTVWSPPSITGMAPGRATFSTSASSAAHERGRVAGEHLDVARVDDPQVLQPVRAQREARAGSRRAPR